MDLFYEYIVRRKKSGKEYLMIAGMVLGALLILFLLLAFAGFLKSFFLLLVAGVIYFLYVGITSLNVEYEYIVTNGDLDIDKITARRKRVRLVSIHSRTFEYFAPLTDEHMAAYNSESITKRLDFTSNTQNGRAYFAIYYKNNDKICLTFEPTEKMVACFARYVPKRAFFAL